MRCSLQLLQLLQLISRSSLIITLLLSTGCTSKRLLSLGESTSVGRQLSKDVHEVRTKGFKAYIEMRSPQSWFNESTRGELIGTVKDSLVVLKDNTRCPFEIPMSAITSIQIFDVIDLKKKPMIFLSIGSVLLTVSNGLFLIFTLPINLVLISIEFSKSSDQEMITLNESERSKYILSKYSRFPKQIPLSFMSVCQLPVDGEESTP